MAKGKPQVLNLKKLNIMGLLCKCPADTAISSITAFSCADSFGQIQKVIFQRIYSSGSTKNKITAADIILLATWQSLMTAADGTKVAVSPFITNPADDGGDARTRGGDNSTLGGVTEIVGKNPVNFSGRIDGAPQSTIEQIETLMCEAQVGNLGVYLIDEYGRFEAIFDTDYYPIPIRSLFVGDKIHGNLDDIDHNNISWSYLPNYSGKLKIVAPTAFNPLTDL